jgi:hypothetical protein
MHGGEWGGPAVRTFPTNPAARHRTWAVAIAGLGLCHATGCVTAWDNITSRGYREKLFSKPYETLFVTPDPLVVLRDSADGDERAKALKRLGKPDRHRSAAQQEEVLTLLATAAKSEKHPLCRLAAIDCLGQYQDPRSAHALVEAFDVLTPGGAAAAGNTGPLARRSIRPDLLAFAPETSRMIQCRTLTALGQTAQPEAAQFLARMARQPAAPAGDEETAHELRLAAVRGLAHCKDAAGSEALVSVLAEVQDKGSREVALRDRAHESLQKSTGKNLPPDATQWQQALGLPVRPAAPAAPAERGGGGVRTVSGAR